MARKAAVAVKEPSVAQRGVPVRADAPLVKANYYGSSVGEMAWADLQYTSGYNGYKIAQYLGLDRLETCVTWPTLDVPNIVGMTTAAADAAIVAAGFIKGTATASAGALGIVLTQDPTPGPSMSPGSAIDYTYGNTP